MTNPKPSRIAELCALSEDESEKREARARAALDPEEAKALVDADRLVALLDEAPRPAPPNAQTLLRVRAMILAELDAEASVKEPAKAPQKARPYALVAAFFALVSLGISLVRGDSGGLEAGYGVRCATLVLLAAAAPYIAVGVTAARRKSAPSPGAYAAIAAGGALAGDVYLAFSCHAHTALHMVVFHTGAVVLAALLGALGSRTLIRATS